MVGAVLLVVVVLAVAVGEGAVVVSAALDRGADVVVAVVVVDDWSGRGADVGSVVATSARDRSVTTDEVHADKINDPANAIEAMQRRDNAIRCISTPPERTGRD